MGKESLLKKLNKRLLTVALSAGIAVSTSACLPNCMAGCNGAGVDSGNSGVTDTVNKTSKIWDNVKNNPDGHFDYAYSKNAHNAAYKYIPYGYLARCGFDIDPILKGENTEEAISGNIICNVADAYFKGNDRRHLYVSSRIVIDHNKAVPYYHFSTLKYTLTEQEYKEFEYLTASYTLASALWVQELSYQKTPEVISAVNVTMQSYHDMINRFPYSFWLSDPYGSNKNYCFIDITGYNIEQQTFSFMVRHNNTATTPFNNAQIRYIDAIPSLSRPFKETNGILEITNWNATEETYKAYPDNYEEIIYYYVSSYHCYTALLPDESKLNK